MNKEPLKETLDSILKKLKQEGSVEEHILLCWQKIPEDFARHAKPIKLQKGVLYLGAEDSNWMYLCSLEREKIEQYLEGFFKQNIITDVKIRVGE
ncbi:MAG: DUF721 domain-containing protein [Candidatus Omnitrophica bacterium]|nr:DUF721 domain-containing protein [Candidatus Omnitrophota bacterium]